MNRGYHLDQILSVINTENLIVLFILFSAFTLINMLFIITVMRACYFLLIAKKDPRHALTIIPKKAWFVTKQKRMDYDKQVGGLS